MHHEVFIDWKFYDKVGLAPMLCCKQCVTTHGLRRGQPQFIKWLGEWELIACRDAGVEEHKLPIQTIIQGENNEQ